VVSFPDLGAKQQVSRQGGFQPLWGATGQDLFFFDRDLSSGTMMAAARAGSPNAVGWQEPRALFKVPRVNDASVARDGRTFYFIAANPDGPAREINVVVNWLQETLNDAPSPAERR
jgi:hypothetical protein